MMLGEGKILKLVMREDLKPGIGMSWVKDLQLSLEMHGCRGINVETLGGDWQ